MMEKTISPFNESKISCTVSDWATGAVEETMSLSDISTRPSPTRILPIFDAFFLLPRNKKTPVIIRTGHTADRSKVRIRAITAVPRSAPSMMVRAGVRAIMPLPKNDDTNMAVALEL